MTNTRSNNEQMEERVNYAADQLAKGKRAMDILATENNWSRDRLFGRTHST